jgi:hypothetical protein
MSRSGNRILTLDFSCLGAIQVLTTFGLENRELFDRWEVLATLEWKLQLQRLKALVYTVEDLEPAVEVLAKKGGSSPEAPLVLPSTTSGYFSLVLDSPDTLILQDLKLVLDQGRNAVTVTTDDLLMVLKLLEEQGVKTIKATSLNAQDVVTPEDHLLLMTDQDRWSIS